MIQFAALILATTPFAFGPQAGDVKPDDNVVRLYDLSTLRIGYSEQQEMLYTSLVPHVDMSLHGRVRDSVGEDESVGGNDRIAELVANVMAPEFEYEGRELDLLPSGRMLVRGPEALQQRVRGLLDFLEQAFNARAKIAVEVVRLPASSAVEPPSTSTVTVDEANAWLASVGEVSRRESYQMELRADGTSVLDIGNDFSAIVDYDVEIAQGMSISDPIAAEVSIGTRLSVQGAPGKNGLNLALVWKRGDPDTENWERDLEFVGMVATGEKKVDYIDQASIVSRLSVLGRGAGLNTFLPDGRALVMVHRLNVPRGVVHEVVLIHAVGETLPALSRTDIGGAGGSLLVLDLGRVAPPVCHAQGWLLWPGQVRHSMQQSIHADDGIGVGFRPTDLDAFAERLAGDWRQLVVDWMGRWLVVLPASEGSGAAMEQARLIRRMDELAPDPRVLDVTVAVRRGKKTVAELRAPVRAGTACSLVVGREELDVYDYDVEVAQFSAVSDPHVFVSFDGVALWMKPSLDGSGGLVLDLRGGVHLALSDSTLDLGGAGGGLVDDKRYAHLMFNELRRLSSERPGTWTTVFGDTSERGLPDSLRLDVSIVAR